MVAVMGQVNSVQTTRVNSCFRHRHLGTTPGSNSGERLHAQALTSHWQHCHLQVRSIARLRTHRLAGPSASPFVHLLPAFLTVSLPTPDHYSPYADRHSPHAARYSPYADRYVSLRPPVHSPLLGNRRLFMISNTSL